MKRLWALVIVAVVIAAAIPTYWILTRPSGSSSQCSLGGGSPPLVVPLGEPPFNVVYNDSAKVGGVWWFNFTLMDDYGVTAEIGQMTLHVTIGGSGSPVPGTIDFLVWNQTHTMIAVANGTNSTWMEGASLPMPSFGTVTVVANSTFPYDAGLMTTVPGPCGESPTAWSEFGP